MFKPQTLAHPAWSQKDASAVGAIPEQGLFSFATFHLGHDMP